MRTMEYYSAINRNKFESVELKSVNLETVTQSEESQKEKNKHCILIHIYGIQKSSTGELTCMGRNRDADVENGLADTEGEGECGLN